MTEPLLTENFPAKMRVGRPFQLLSAIMPRFVEVTSFLQFPSILFAVFVAVLEINSAQATGPKKVEYNRDIRPILSDKCFYCHGPDAKHREADLRLDEEASAKDFALIPGKPDESEVFRRITSEDEAERMPPLESGKSLTPAEIELIQRWIQAGAEYQPHWAYVVPKRHPIPKVKNTTWPKSWIDRFLLAQMEAEGIQPSPDADAVTLVRRLHFDLTGLPPSPETVQAFLSNPDEANYEAMIDRLLASDHFGERMAVYWLDLVRYADTVGYHGDQDHNISPYRDYIIEAFNDNLPFDQMTREQLAGDLLPGSTVDQKTASGYNRLLQTTHEGGLQPKEYLAIYAADRVRNVSNVWMGATVGCAQCHDHKFDPYTAKDFYAFQAFFADLDEAQHFKLGSNALPTRRPPELKVLSKREREKISELESQIQKLEQQHGADNKPRIAAVRKEIQTLQKNARLTMISAAIKPRTIRILPRGDWLNETGPIVTPAYPEFEAPNSHTKKRLTRLDLANWLCDPKAGTGGLTARVFVNRLWYLMFGAGISRSLDDFGGQGEPPSHPELLDHLAIEFSENGWNVKRMIKQIVMSRAYRQSSIASSSLVAVDPSNRLFARQSRYRLPAEFVRDTALSISGLLDPTIGGPSVRPYQPAGYYRHLNFPTRTYKPDRDERQWRRGVYVHWQRQFLHPMLKAFDASNREECVAERPRSNTPLAALTMLNDPTFVEASRMFAQRILKADAKTDRDRLKFAYLEAVSREPDARESELLLKLLAANRQHYSKNPKLAEDFLNIGLADVKTPQPIELAAWANVARAILNMSETTTRN